jgi:nascent polypeptide-associated complex subunit alpha
MMPGMNPRMMKQAMRKLGMQQEDIEATEVIIKCPDKDIVISNPSVAKVNMMGQESWQITGDVEERGLDTKPEINEEDVKTVSEQTGVSEDDARETILKNNGDLAAAILELKKE